MFSSIMKLFPRLDRASLNEMQKQLGSRFANVAKKFGRGMVGALKGGGIVGVALGLIDKLLNPIKEVQEAIDRTLNSADDLVTNANQFGTDAGRLAKLRAIGESTGLSGDNLYMLIAKFQSAIAEANADRSKPSAVSNYLDTKDMAEGFFTFIQQLQKMDANERTAVQLEVFGEKQILKMAEFLATDFPKQMSKLKLGSTEEARRGAEAQAGLADLRDILSARRNYEDISVKGRVMNEGMIKAMDQTARMELARENERIQGYRNLESISQTVFKLTEIVERQLNLFGSLLGKLQGPMNRFFGFIEKIQGSKWARGIFGGAFGKGE